MHLKRRQAAERLQRLRLRLRSYAQGARGALSSPLIELANRSPDMDRSVSAGASAACGTWADRPDGRRRSRRVPVSAEISMRKMGSFSFLVPLGDISTRGCMVELVEFIDAGDHVIARFPGLEPFGARVTWSDAHCAGVEFERSLHPAVFEQLLTRLV
jgi:hypothetical protein